MCSRAIANIRKRSLAAKSIRKRVETTTNVCNYFPAIVSKIVSIVTCTLPTVSSVISDRRICGSKRSVISASRVLFLRGDVFRLILVRFIATTLPRVRASLISVFIGRSIGYKSFPRFCSRVLYANSSSRSSSLPTQHSRVFATTVLQFPLRASSKRSRLTNIQVKPVARGCFSWNGRRGTRLAGAAVDTADNTRKRNAFYVCDDRRSNNSLDLPPSFHLTLRLFQYFYFFFFLCPTLSICLSRSSSYLYRVAWVSIKRMIFKRLAVAYSVLEMCGGK